MCRVREPSWPRDWLFGDCDAMRLLLCARRHRPPWLGRVFAWPTTRYFTCSRCDNVVGAQSAARARAVVLLGLGCFLCSQSLPMMAVATAMPKTALSHEAHEWNTAVLVCSLGKKWNAAGDSSDPAAKRARYSRPVMYASDSAS